MLDMSKEAKQKKEDDSEPRTDRFFFFFFTGVLSGTKDSEHLFKHSLNKKQAGGSLIFSWTSRIACSPVNSAQLSSPPAPYCVDHSSNFLELFCQDLDLRANGAESQPCYDSCGR